MSNAFTVSSSLRAFGNPHAGACLGILLNPNKLLTSSSTDAGAGLGTAARVPGSWQRCVQMRCRKCRCKCRFNLAGCGMSCNLAGCSAGDAAPVVRHRRRRRRCAAAGVPAVARAARAAVPRPPRLVRAHALPGCASHPAALKPSGWLPNTSAGAASACAARMQMSTSCAASAVHCAGGLPAHHTTASV